MILPISIFSPFALPNDSLPGLSKSTNATSFAESNYNFRQVFPHECLWQAKSVTNIMFSIGSSVDLLQQYL